MDFVGGIIFSNFGARHVASQRFFSRKSTFLCFFGPYGHFSWFFWVQKDAQRNLAHNDVYKSPWSPEFDHLVKFWIMSVQNNPCLSWSLHMWLPPFAEGLQTENKSLSVYIYIYIYIRLQLKRGLFSYFLHMFYKFIQILFDLNRF